ncbi:4Fe-4S single cluster domain-containing protein [Amycolatopsis sp. NPDC051102]|uniref:4Fe-4S single cluster domain-containing protein n=1 Tax=Amycolatopsis sp. NPDC051102 TaxID=3155163 RepID=UPI00344546DC
MTAVRINRMHHPLTVLGHGVRAGIWLQGCTIGCAGCASRDTWDPAAGEDVEPAAVVRWLGSLGGPLDGITVSGGEPFQQPLALAALLAELDEWRRGRDRPADLLVFSGYPHARLSARADCADALRRCDAVVAGPYVERRNRGTELRGSDNQEIVTLTPLGAERYGRSAAAPAPAMQLSADADAVRLIGIPRRGDLDRLRAGLAARGITAEAVTWLA